MANGFYNYNSDLDAFSLYHLVQEESEKNVASQSGGPVLPALGHALSGAMAAALAKTLVYPIETIVTRMQVQSQLKGSQGASSESTEYTSLLDAMRKIYHVEGGIKAFYPGLGADVSKGMIDTFLFFFAYTALRQRQARKAGTTHLPVLQELGVGILAGCLAKAITTPIQSIVTRQQTAAIIAARDPTSTTTAEQSGYLSFSDVAKQIRSEKGIAGFWSGYSASAILTLNPAITFAAENALRRLLPRDQREKPTARTIFLLAALSKVIATTITYPVMVAKSRAQASQSAPRASDDRTSHAEKGPDQRVKAHANKGVRVLAAQATLLLSLRDVYRKEGVSGLYAGLHGELLKGFVQHGLTMTVKDRVHGGVIQAYYALLKLSNRWPDSPQQVRADVVAVARDAGDRVGNVSVTVAEAAMSLGKKAVGSDDE